MQLPNGQTVTMEECKMAREMQNIHCMAEFFKNVTEPTVGEKIEISESEKKLRKSNRLGEAAKAKGKYRTAMKYFLPCAKEDYAPSIYNYAMMCYQGLGVKKKKETAGILFELAARKGEPRALAMLSEMYVEGYWVTRSFRKAYLCAEVAADYCAEGKLQLAKCFDEGIGVTPDIRKAIVLRIQADEEKNNAQQNY